MLMISYCWESSSSEIQLLEHFNKKRLHELAYKLKARPSKIQSSKVSNRSFEILPFKYFINESYTKKQYNPKVVQGPLHVKNSDILPFMSGILMIQVLEHAK